MAASRPGAISSRWARYLLQCVCILSDRAELASRLERVTGKIADRGGEHWLLAIPAVPAGEEVRLLSSLRERRNEEYAEIIAECETTFVKEIESEHFRKSYSFEEAEKIRRWFKRVTERDWFGADRRADVESRIERCPELLAQFEDVVVHPASDDVPPGGSPLRSVTPPASPPLLTSPEESP